MEVITVTHSASGAKATIHPFGATALSYSNATGKQLLFVSNIAKLDGTKAIRGGIPLVFPHFGPDSTGTMPQHGFLRTNQWEVLESSRFDNAEEAGISFQLPLEKAVNSRGGAWDIKDPVYDCHVTFHVKITASSLITTLEIENTGSTPIPFQALQHTYLKVDNALDPATCNVSGLEGYECDDKITGETYTLAQAAPIIIDRNVDRVYSNSNKKDLEVVVKTGADTSVKVEASGSVDGTPVAISGVVWNPFEQKAKEMSDFGDEQYKEMICVEPGMLNNIPAVEKKAIFTQTLTAL